MEERERMELAHFTNRQERLDRALDRAPWRRSQPETEEDLTEVEVDEVKPADAAAAADPVLDVETAVVAPTNKRRRGWTGPLEEEEAPVTKRSRKVKRQWRRAKSLNRTGDRKDRKRRDKGDKRNRRDRDASHAMGGAKPLMAR